MQGLPSVFMAKIIQEEFVDTGTKALIFCGVQQALTNYRNIKYEENTRESGFREVRSAGNIVYDRIGPRAATVLLHYLWPDEDAMYRVARPVGGAFDALMGGLDRDRIQGAVRTGGTPFGELAVSQGIYAYKHENLTLKDLCQGYIIMGPLHEHTMVTAIPDFISVENINEALRDFPAPKDTLPTIKEPDKDAPAAAQYMNNLIAGYTQNVSRVLDLFKYP